MTVACLFCQSHANPRSREHMISEPAARVLGISRGSDYLVDEIDGRTGDVTIEPAPLRAHRAYGVCEPCNNGWMSRLEVEFATSLSRVRQSNQVDTRGFETISRWHLKTSLVAHLRSARWNRGDLRASIPPLERARGLKDGNPASLNGVVVGVGRSSDGHRLCAVGGPKIVPADSPVQPHAFLQVFAVSSEQHDEQLWIASDAAPLFEAVSLPAGVDSLEPGYVWSNRPNGSPLDPELVRARINVGVIQQLLRTLDRFNP